MCHTEGPHTLGEMVSHTEDPHIPVIMVFHNHCPTVLVSYTGGLIFTKGSRENGDPGSYFPGNIMVVMSEFPKLCKFSPKQAISSQCLNKFAQTCNQDFQKGGYLDVCMPWQYARI